MGVNEVKNADGEILMTTIGDTVSAETLLEGETATDSTGEKITGTLQPYRSELLDNSDFSVNQRNVSGIFSDVGEYFADRWKLVEGTVTVTDSGIQLSGTIEQTLEKSVGTETSAFVGGQLTASASYDDSTRTYRLTSLGDEISYASLTLKTAKTPVYVRPHPAEELARCQRYALALNQYVRYGASLVSVNFIDFLIPTPSTMRVTPSIDTSKLAVHQTGSTAVEGFAFSILSKGDNGIMIRATKASHGLSWAYLSLTENLIVSADL